MTSTSICQCYLLSSHQKQKGSNFALQEWHQASPYPQRRMLQFGLANCLEPIFRTDSRTFDPRWWLDAKNVEEGNFWWFLPSGEESWFCGGNPCLIPLSLSVFTFFNFYIFLCSPLVILHLRYSEEVSWAHNNMQSNIHVGARFL